MANTIKLKRGTSTPTTSDIVNGEVAIDTSAQKLFVNDGGTVKEIGGGSSVPTGGGSDKVFFENAQTVTTNYTISGTTLDFGSGNAPNNITFQKSIQSYINDGGVVVNITQCNSGFVQQDAYANSAFFQKIGVISGKDLTTEAAVTKMMYLFENVEDKKEIESLLKIDLCGEMTMVKSS